jgi:putative phage-type endonuclease
MNAPDRAAWLAARRKGIGGSDIAAIIGASPWRTPVDIYLDKIDESPPDEKAGQSERMEWGTLLEPVVATKAASVLDQRWQRVNRQIHDPQRPWAMGNIDRAIVAAGTRARIGSDGLLAGALGIAEVKTAGERSADEWGDDNEPLVPTHYQAQGQWYLGIARASRCVFACLIGGQRLVLRTIERDEELFAHMLEQGERFWTEHVLKRRPPPPRTAADALRLWPRHVQGITVDASSNAAMLEQINNLRALRADAKALAEAITASEDTLKLAMRGAESIILGNAPLITWKASRDSQETDWQAVAAEFKQTIANFEWANEIIARHTRIKPGSRRFIVKASD